MQRGNAEQQATGETADKMDAAYMQALYKRYVEMVYRICLLMTGRVADAEDMTQSVFVKLMERRKGFTDAEHEKAWLIVVAKNACTDLHRRWWRKSTDALLDRDKPSPDGAQTSLEVRAAVMGLPAKLRLLVYLRYYEGYKVREVARMLRMNENTIKARLAKARAQLKLELGDDEYE